MSRVSYVGRTFRCVTSFYYFTVGAQFPGEGGRAWCVGRWERADALRRQVCDGYQIISGDSLDDPDQFLQVINVPPHQWHCDIPRVDLVHRL